MPNPADLPPELFELVIDHAIDGKDDMQSFYRFCLVSRQWYAIVSPLLYYEWRYDGDAHSFISLWRFCRTMLQNTQIAEYVRVLDVGYWGFHSIFHPDDSARFPQEDLPILHGAVLEAGLQELQTQIDTFVQDNDRRPLMALLLTALPNLRSISAHIPEKDPYLAKVLKLASSAQDNESYRRAFQKLEKAEVMSEWHTPPGVYHYERFDTYLLNLDYLWPIFRLPSLQELSVLDFDPNDASVYFKDCAGTSSITHLTIVCHDKTPVLASDARSLITLPKALVSLSMYLDDAWKETKKLTNEEMWLALEPHRESLEYLDFYRVCTGVGVPNSKQRVSQFGSLHTFNRLTHLYIQPEILLGPGCDRTVAPFRLKNTLPHRLKNLTLYEMKGLLYNESLGDQITEVLENSDFTALSSIVLEDVSRANAYLQNPIVLPYQQVKQACRKSNVAYKKVKSKHRRMGRRKGKPVILLKGGSESALLHKAASMRYLKGEQYLLEEERIETECRREEREEKRTRRSRRFEFVEPDDDEVDWMTSNSDLADTASEEAIVEEEESEDTESEATDSES